MLRPDFTQQLATTLLSDKHVNLVSPHGRGRRQTLLDLETLLCGYSVRKIDLKREQKRWDSWFRKTLSMDEAIVIIHNYEYVNAAMQRDLKTLDRFTLLLVSELPVLQVRMQKVEIPRSIT